MEKKIVVLHSGIQHSNYIAESLYRAGLLEKYITPFLSNKYMRLYSRVFPRSKASKVISLRTANIPPKLTHTKNLWFIWNLLFLKKPIKQIEREFLTKHVSLKKGTIVYTWPLQMKCLKGFMNCKFILELPIGYFPYLSDVIKSLTYKMKYHETIGFSYSNKEMIQFRQELEFSKVILSPSDFVSNSLLYYHPDFKDKLIKISYATTLRKINNRASAGDELKILYVGQISERKGLTILDKIIENYKENKKIVFTMIGQKTAQNKLYNDFDFSRVEYHESCTREELTKFFSSHSIIVLPSIFEGSALVLHEAFSAGMCVLASKNSGADYIIDGHNGFICDLNSEEYIRVIDNLYHNKNALKQVLNNVKNSKKPSWDDSIKVISQIVSNL